jgi:hypothetical protein
MPSIDPHAGSASSKILRSFEKSEVRGADIHPLFENRTVDACRIGLRSPSWSTSTRASRSETPIPLRFLRIPTLRKHVVENDPRALPSNFQFSNKTRPTATALLIPTGAKEQYSRRRFYPRSSQQGAVMMIRFNCFGAFFVALALAGPAWGAGGCGVGCSSTSEGACVREGWQQGLPVRNECPATTRPTPPCGPHHRWSRQAMSCVLR